MNKFKQWLTIATYSCGGLMLLSYFVIIAYRSKSKSLARLTVLPSQ